MALTDRQLKMRPFVRLWLSFCLGLVFLMVIVGGATRLTDSGLSITEWKPILGAIPPLSQADWLDVFEKYKQIPEYTRVNQGMTLQEFKGIFWWEWGHRFLGRFIGLVFFLPFLLFLLTKSIEKPLIKRCWILLILGGLQGLLGWYMVMSGLVDRVDVSQYRLAAHLGLALVIYSIIYWFYLGLNKQSYGHHKYMALPSRMAFIVGVALVGFIFIQILAGAFVAGMRAGLAYNSWPTMNGDYIPSGLMIMKPWWRNLFENATTVQFNHRMIAYGLFVFAFMIWLWAKMHHQKSVRPLFVVLLLVLFQIALGIFTLLAQVPLWLGLAHQGGAILVLTAGVYYLHTSCYRH